ncbi:shikimate dehydrogenase family protein [Maricaulaceae bacterium MS644]
MSREAPDHQPIDREAPFAAVAGWPAAHSLSPAMMACWLSASGREGRYGVLEIPPERFARAVHAARAMGMAGLNVTLPHKTAALILADEVSDAARRVGAANLLTFQGDGRIRADNTDIVGVAAALSEDAGAGPAVLIGAGGAARAALFHLAGQSREIRIVNRTRAAAARLAAEFGLEASVYETPEPRALNGAALVINATSLGMAGKPALAPDFTSCAPDALAFDMVYTPLQTPFLAAARLAGLKTADGLSMLIGQARPSFEAFFGAPPPEGCGVRALLEARLEARR